MDFLKEFERRCKEIDKLYGVSKIPEYKPLPRYQPLRRNSVITLYDLVVKDMEGKTIKELAWGLTLKECITLGKHYNKSKLIRESEGLYSLQYVKIERGIYEEDETEDRN